MMGDDVAIQSEKKKLPPTNKLLSILLRERTSSYNTCPGSSSHDFSL